MRTRRDLFIPIGLVGFSILCYLSVVPMYFLSDDFYLIGRVADQGMFYSWQGFLRPGTILSYVIDHWIWGLNPVGYHLTNILFHSLTAYSVFLFARYFFGRVQLAQSVPLSVLAACMFVALPSHTESVTWIAGRTDVIATALGLLATCYFLRALENKRLIDACLALFLFSGALLTKESIVVLPLIWSAILLFDWWSQKKAPAGLVTGMILASFLLLAGYLILRKVTIGQFIGGYGTEIHTSIARISSLRHLYEDILRTFLPALPLRFAGQIQRLITPWMAGFATLLFVSVLALLRKRFRWSLVVLLTSCYLISLIPTITMGVHLFDTQGERYLYLASAFACPLLAYFFAAAFSRARLRHLPFILLVALILLQSIALQWVNRRWVTASYLTRKIAGEVATVDPASTIVLNVPDNFKGAYIFRNGLPEATTIFLGKPMGIQIRSIIIHDVNSIDEVFQARADEISLSLSLPPGIEYMVHDIGYRVEQRGQSLAVTDPSGLNSGVRSFLSFTSGASVPMFQQLGRYDVFAAQHVTSSLAEAREASGKGDIIRARAAYSATLASDLLENTRFEIVFEWGTMERFYGDSQKAAALFEQALALRPDDVAAHAFHGAVLQDLHQLEAAIGEFDWVIAHQPVDFWAYFLRGLAYRDLGKPGIALASLTQALTLAADPGTQRLAAEAAFAVALQLKDCVAASDLLRQHSAAFAAPDQARQQLSGICP